MMRDKSLTLAHQNSMKRGLGDLVCSTPLCVRPSQLPGGTVAPRKRGQGGNPAAASFAPCSCSVSMSLPTYSSVTLLPLRSESWLTPMPLLHRASLPRCPDVLRNQGPAPCLWAAGRQLSLGWTCTRLSDSVSSHSGSESGTGRRGADRLVR